MTTFLILLGFIVYFLGIGSIINLIKEIQNSNFIYRKLQNIGFFLWGFTAVYGITFGIYLSNQSKGKIYSTSILMISVFIGICFLPVVASLYISRRKRKVTLIYEEEINKKETVLDLLESSLDNNQKQYKKWNKKDYLAIIGITIIGAIMIFYRLGSLEAPQNGLTLISNEKAENEIILDFGENTYLKEMYIFLGHMDSRKIAVSYFDEELYEWVVITKDSEAESVYNWSKIEIDHHVRYLGIVSRNTKAVYNEMIIVGQEEQKLLPINYMEYEALFDEQELFPTDITYYYRTMFDEVYYSRSAFELLQGMDMYEYTHPPLGKIFMAVGVALFGVTPFGWRFACAVFGVMMLPVIYMFVRKITGKTKYAAFAISLCSMDFMHLTLSRIATIDSIVAFFIISMFTIMYYLLSELKDRLVKERYEVKGRFLFYLFMGAIITGCAVAVKWTGFYAAGGIALLFLIFICNQFITARGNRNKRKFLGKITLLTGTVYVFFTGFIYLLSYIPMGLAQGKSVWKAMWENSKMMFSFHSDIVFDHPYSSPWYTWPLDLVPLIDASNILKDRNNTVSVIATFGNPIIWWGGLAAFCFILYRAVFKKDKRAGYLSLSYLAMQLPWCFVMRTVFIYQYYACALLLCVILAYAVERIDQYCNKFSALFLESALICLIMFYPIITGMPVSAYTVRVFMVWLSRWKFV